MKPPVLQLKRPAIQAPTSIPKRCQSGQKRPDCPLQDIFLQESTGSSPSFSFQNNACGAAQPESRTAKAQRKVRFKAHIRTNEKKQDRGMDDGLFPTVSGIGAAPPAYRPAAAHCSSGKLPGDCVGLDHEGQNPNPVFIIKDIVRNVRRLRPFPWLLRPVRWGEIHIPARECIRLFPRASGSLFCILPTVRFLFQGKVAPPD